MIDEIILDTEPDLQPPHTIQGQITDEGEVAEIHDLMMQEDYVPLCYEEFQFIRQNIHNISKGKDEHLIGCHTVSIDTSQQSPQVFDDHFAHVLDSVCRKNSSPSANHVIKENADSNMIPRPPSLSCLIDFSLQSLDRSFQSYEEIDKGDIFF